MSTTGIHVGAELDVAEEVCETIISILCAEQSDHVKGLAFECLQEMMTVDRTTISGCTIVQNGVLVEEVAEDPIPGAVGGTGDPTVGVTAR